MPKLTLEQQEARRTEMLQKLEQLRGMVQPYQMAPVLKMVFYNLLFDILDYLIRR